MDSSPTYLYFIYILVTEISFGIRAKSKLHLGTDAGLPHVQLDSQEQTAFSPGDSKEHRKQRKAGIYV